MSVSALIVAAGRSTRMGAFKPLLPLGGESMSRRVVSRLQAAGAAEIVVVTGCNAKALEAHLSGPGVVFRRNPDYASTGMFDSAKIGLAALQGRCEWLFFTPVDVPLFSVETLRRLLACPAPAAVPVWQGRRGHPLLLSAELIPGLLADSGEGGLRGALERLGVTPVGVAAAEAGVVLDADTPEDFAELLGMLEDERGR